MIVHFFNESSCHSKNFHCFLPSFQDFTLYRFYRLKFNACVFVIVSFTIDSNSDISSRNI